MRLSTVLVRSSICCLLVVVLFAAPFQTNEPHPFSAAAKSGSRRGLFSVLVVMLRVATRRARRLRCRSLPTRALSYPRTTLKQPVGNPELAGGSRSRPILVHNAPTEISILDNGLRVATQGAFGQYCTIGGQ